MTILNKALLRSKAKSFVVYWKKGKTNNQFMGVMQLYISYYRRGIKGRKYKLWKVNNKQELLY